MEEYSPFVAQLLYNRGITEHSDAETFLAVDKSLQDTPLLLPDVEKATARIHQALRCDENIAVYGDFDADGVCGTAVLAHGLTILGGKVTPYIPHRLKEDRGLSSTALEQLRQQGFTLVVTVDCGITAIAEVEHASKLGMDIIITDHHNTLPVLPAAIAVVDPKRKDSSYPFQFLAGAGVAYKFMQAVFRSMGRNEEECLEELLDLVAIATIADLVPLVGENRYLVHRGLQVLNQTKWLGLRELIGLAGLRLGAVDEERVSWTIGPRINAAGRIDWALTSYKLLMSDTIEEAQNLARELEERNTERQQLTEDVLANIKEQMSPDMLDLPLMMIEGDDYPLGVIGLAAGKLVEEFYRPAIVVALGPDKSHGSARSIPEFDIVAALQECQDILPRFGGHPGAAGFTIPTGDLPLLRQRLLEIAQRKLAAVELQPTYIIDSEWSLASLDWSVYKDMQRFAPFGQSNPQPTFLSRQVNVIECRTVGANGDHLKLKLRDGKFVWYGIGFDLGHRWSEVTSSIDVVHNVGLDRWGRGEFLQLNILDFAPSPR